MPNGDAWKGSYDMQMTCIKGLEDMMVFYSVKPFHFMLIHYFGGPDFELEIFSPNAVEIAYPWRNLTNHSENCPGGGGESNTNVYDYVEVDKLCASLSLNASNVTWEGYTVVLQKDHVQHSKFFNVIVMNIFA